MGLIRGLTAFAIVVKFNALQSLQQLQVFKYQICWPTLFPNLATSMKNMTKSSNIKFDILANNVAQSGKGFGSFKHHIGATTIGISDV